MPLQFTNILTKEFNKYSSYFNLSLTLSIAPSTASLAHSAASFTLETTRSANLSPSYCLSSVNFPKPSLTDPLISLNLILMA